MYTWYWYNHKSFQSNQSGIETATEQRSKWLLSLPIEPKWNWNTPLLYRYLFQPMASNRTKVELKPISHLIDKNIRLFQSNQSGIETKHGWLIVECTYPSNRTKVELKRRKAGVGSFRYSFQSNQSGIETQQRHSKSLILLSSNRTKVELKRISIKSISRQ